MGSHKGREEGQGARTAFRKAPKAPPPETRFTVKVNDFLERFKLLELSLLPYSERLALAAVDRGTSRASNDHASARFRARRRDCGGGGGLRVHANTKMEMYKKR